MTKVNKVRLKICGMKDERNILQVAALQPDYMGFIFYPKSPRYVGADFVIPSAFPSTIKRVGVFVNEGTSKMIQLAKQHELDYLQLHGHESVKQCSDLKNEGFRLIKVFSIDEHADFTITEQYKDVVDFFLFDTKGKYYGGNAMAFNWSVLSAYNQSLPFF